MRIYCDFNHSAALEVGSGESVLVFETLLEAIEAALNLAKRSSRVSLTIYDPLGVQLLEMPAGSDV